MEIKCTTWLLQLIILCCIFESCLESNLKSSHHKKLHLLLFMVMDVNWTCGDLSQYTEIVNHYVVPLKLI